MARNEQAYQVFEERLWDELGIRKKGDPPTNLSALLSDLGVVGQSREAKTQAVKRWLEDNETLLVLRLELEDEGFI